MKAAITGATSGIGREAAYYLFEKGWDLVLTGRNKKELAALEKEFGECVKTKALDLSREDEVYEFYDLCKDDRIDMFINNAGFGVFGRFDKVRLEKELELIDVNIKANHILTKLFLKKFEEQNRGIILNVASSAGFMPGPMMSSYYASKNYVLALSLAINEELKRSGSKVRISVFCPGPVNTEFNKRAGVDFSFRPIDSSYAAKYAIEKAMEGKTVIVPGITMKTAVTMSKFVPKKLLTHITYGVQKKKEKN